MSENPPPRITDPPPQVQADLERLRTALDEAVLPKILDRNLLIATWNIRSFGSLTKSPGSPRKADSRPFRWRTWRAATSTSPPTP